MVSSTILTSLAVLLLTASTLSAFQLVNNVPAVRQTRVLQSSTSTTSTASAETRPTVPTSLDEMVRQVASAVKQSKTNDSPNLFIVRILLPRDRNSGDIGRYYEGSSSIDSNNIMLVPTDESWQGGIMQLYRAAEPTATAILRQLVASTVPTRITEDRSVDESGVDGVGLLRTEDNSYKCWIQPTQEVVDEIVKQSSSDVNTTTILINPQWRLIDDALDVASKGEGFFANLASFLGGKGNSLKQLAQAGFKPIYTLEGYVCRGCNIRLVQVGADSDWNVYCERDDGESYIYCGSTNEGRPSYQQVDDMLKNAGISYKFSRDMGMEPKL